MTTTPVHLMILAVVQDQDLDTATRALETWARPSFTWPAAVVSSGAETPRC